MLAKGAEADQYQQQNIQLDPAGHKLLVPQQELARQRKLPILDQRAQSSSNVSTEKSSMHLMGSRNTEVRVETGVHCAKQFSSFQGHNTISSQMGERGLHPLHDF